MARAFGPRIAVKRSSSTVNPSAIASMFVEGGDIHGEARSLQRDAVRSARRAAPRRSGFLRRTVQGDRVGTTGLQNRFNVYAWAHYAKWVSEGTRPVITAWRRNDMLTLYAHGRRAPAQYAGSEYSRHLWVRGQDPNPFLEIGLAEAMAKHGYL